MQRQIVDEIAGYQRIIDGARQVVDNWRPDFFATLETEVTKGIEDLPYVHLRQITKLLSGGTPSKQNSDYWTGTIPWVSPKDMKSLYIDDTQDHISDDAVKNCATKLVPPNTILVVVRSGILTHSFPIALTNVEVAFNQDITAILCDNDKIEPKYLMNFLIASEKSVLESGVKRGGTVHSLYSNFLSELQIPLPPLDVQREIVARIERERAIVEANRELIEIYQQKITAAVNRVWESA